jgi:gluconokinase
MLPETLTRRTYVGEGGVEFDTDPLFADLCAVIDEVLERCEKLKGDITHVASCSFWHSLVGIDEKGKPTTKVLTWADTRSREYTGVLRKRFDETEVQVRTGARFHSSFWPSKLLFIREEFPDIWKRTDRWLSLSDYLFLRLCGNTTTSVSMASATGIFDQRKCEWDAKLLGYLKLSVDKVPKIAASADESFVLSTRFQTRWPRLKSARWFPAIGDGAANNVGAGCTNRSKAALMIGTSGAMRVAYEGEPAPKLPSGLWCYRIDRKRAIVGGALSDGGGLYQWLKKNLRVDLSDEEIGAEIAHRGATHTD